jgi:hypothetical protein
MDGALRGVGQLAVHHCRRRVGHGRREPDPVAGPSRKPWQERLAGAGFRSIAYSILIAVMLLLWGLAGRKPLQDNAVGFPDKVGDINHYFA